MISKETNPHLEITWYAAKAASNLSRHGVSFVLASSVFLDALALTLFDSAHSEFEERWFTLGMADTGKLLALSHTHQSAGPIQVKIRIISARIATRAERKQYENEQR